MYDIWNAIQPAVDAWIPVRLVDSVDHVSPKTGIAYSGLTVKYQTVGTAGAGTAYSPSAQDWVEKSNGDYALRIGASEFATCGLYRVTVAASACLTYTCIVSVGIDLANVAADNASRNNLYAMIRRIHALMSGNAYERDAANAPHENVFYAEDGTTPLIRHTWSVDENNIERLEAGDP